MSPNSQLTEIFSLGPVNMKSTFVQIMTWLYNRQQAFHWTNDSLVYKHALLDLSELTPETCGKLNLNECVNNLSFQMNLKFCF